jgi:hypothetical protein
MTGNTQVKREQDLWGHEQGNDRNCASPSGSLSKAAEMNGAEAADSGRAEPCRLGILDRVRRPKQICVGSD